jgi:hypothetical protein
MLLSEETRAAKPSWPISFPGIARPELLLSYGKFNDMKLRVRWFDPDPHNVEILVRPEGIRQTLDGRAVPHIPRPFRTVTAPHFVGPEVVANVQGISRQLGLDAVAVRGLLEDLANEPDGIIRDVSVNHDGLIELSLDWFGATQQCRLGESAPSRLWATVLLELAVAYARQQATVETTMLLLDDFLAGYHGQAQVDIIDRLRKRLDGIQVVVTTHSPFVVAGCGPDWILTVLGGTPRATPNLFEALGYGPTNTKESLFSQIQGFRLLNH